MSESKRKIFTGAQKAKVAIGSGQGSEKPSIEIAQEHGVHHSSESMEKKIHGQCGSLLKANEGRNRSMHRAT